MLGIDSAHPPFGIAKVDFLLLPLSTRLVASHKLTVASEAWQVRDKDAR